MDIDVQFTPYHLLKRHYLLLKYIFILSFITSALRGLTPVSVIFILFNVSWAVFIAKFMFITKL